MAYLPCSSKFENVWNLYSFVLAQNLNVADQTNRKTLIITTAPDNFTYYWFSVRFRCSSKVSS